MKESLVQHGLVLAFATACRLALAQGVNTNTTTISNSSIVRLPNEWLHLLPNSFNSTIEYGWLNSTVTGNETVNALLAKANQARFVSYSDEFDAIVGHYPTWTTISTPPGDPHGAFEGGAWIPELDEVWFSFDGFFYPFNETIAAFSLSNGTARQIKTDPPIRYSYGQYYWPFDGHVYVSEFADSEQLESVVAIDPKTLKSTPIFNSYFGMRLNTCNDLTLTRVNGKDYIFATTPPVEKSLHSVPSQSYDTAVWRFSLTEKTLLPVIDSNQVFKPNGIRVSPDGQRLYVTNTPFVNPTTQAQQAGNISLSNSVYVFDLTADAMPVNGRLFALTRTGIANGMHIDGKGRVWTAENDGILVRSPNGQVLGMLNYHPFHPIYNDPTPLANFALAGNRLVMGLDSYVLVYHLNETLVTNGTITTN